MLRCYYLQFIPYPSSQASADPTSDVFFSLPFLFRFKVLNTSTNVPFSSFSTVVHKMSFSKCVCFQNLSFSKSPGENVQFSCEWEAYPQKFSPFLNCAFIL